MDAVFEIERIFGAQVGEPFFERILVEKLADAFPRGQVEVMLAFGTDVAVVFRFLAEDGGLALGQRIHSLPARHAWFGLRLPLRLLRIVQGAFTFRARSPDLR